MAQGHPVWAWSARSLARPFLVHSHAPMTSVARSPDRPPPSPCTLQFLTISSAPHGPVTLWLHVDPLARRGPKPTFLHTGSPGHVAVFRGLAGTQHS